MATIAQHGRRWRFRWRGAWVTRDSHEAAVAALTQLRGEADRGAALEAVRRTGGTPLVEMVEAWLEWKQGSVRAKTWVGYRTVIRTHIASLVGDMCAERVEGFELQDRLYDVLTSSSAAADAHTILNQAFRWAIMRRRIDRRDNPCQIARPNHRRLQNDTGTRPVEDQDIPAPVEVEKMIRWAAEVGQTDWWLWLVIESTLGARPGEVCALRREDFDLGEGAVRLERRAPDYRDPTDWRQKTPASRRILRVGVEWVERLVPLLPSGGFLFPSSGNIPCWPSERSAQRWRVMREALHLPTHYIPRSLRHFVATRLLADGESEIQVARWLGHADGQMVRRL